MVLKLPTDESFARLGTIVSASATHPAHEWSYLSHGAFSLVGSGTVPTSDFNGYLSTNLPGFSSGAACLDGLAGTGSGDTLMRHFVTTWEPGVDAEVRAALVRRCVDSSSAASVDGGFRGCVILTRVGGSYGYCSGAGTPKSEALVYADFYALWITSSSTAPSADLTVRLLGVTHSSSTGPSGTARELAKHFVPGGVAGLDLSAAVDASISITNVSGSPTITCTLFGYSIGGSQLDISLFDSAVGGTVTLGSGVTASGGVLTDAHADKITANGAVGFGLPASRADTVSGTAVDVTEGIVRFAVSTVAGASLLEDDFSRVAIGAAAVEGLGFNLFHRAISVHGDEGAWLNSLWAYGSTAATDNTVDDVDPLLGRTVVGTTLYDAVDYARPHTTVAVPSGSTPQNREFFSTRPSDLSYSHHRSLDFQVFGHVVAEPNWTGAIDRYGVLLRGAVTQGFVTTAIVAYLEPIFTDSGGLSQTSLKCKLAIRLETAIGGDATYLSMWEKTLTGVDLADGLWHTLDYDVHIVESAQSIGAPLIHKVTVDGTVVVFDTAGAFASGTQVLADGRVFDASGFAPTTPGSVEGFFIYSSISETDNASNVLRTPAKIRNWNQGTLTDFGGGVAPEDQASYAWITDEGASTVTGDLSSIVDIVFPVQVRRVAADAVESKLDSGHRATRARATRTRRLWNLTTAPMDFTARRVVEAFFAAHGPEVPFNWTPDGEAAVIVKFADAPRYGLVAPGLWAAKLAIQEVLA